MFGSSVVWKGELSSNKTGFLSEEICKQSFEGAAWSPPPPMAYSKMQERNELKKEPEVKDLENTQVIHTVKNEKVCSEENTKGRADTEDLIGRLVRHESQTESVTPAGTLHV